MRHAAAPGARPAQDAPAPRPERSGRSRRRRSVIETTRSPSSSARPRRRRRRRVADELEAVDAEALEAGCGGRRRRRRRVRGAEVGAAEAGGRTPRPVGEAAATWVQSEPDPKERGGGPPACPHPSGCGDQGAIPGELDVARLHGSILLRSGPGSRGQTLTDTLNRSGPPSGGPRSGSAYVFGAMRERAPPPPRS